MGILKQFFCRHRMQDTVTIYPITNLRDMVFVQVRGECARGCGFTATVMSGPLNDTPQLRRSLLERYGFEWPEPEQEKEERRKPYGD